MGRTIISVLLLCLLLCCVVHHVKGAVFPANKRTKRDESTRWSGRGGVDAPTDWKSIHCLLPGFSDLFCIGPQISLFGTQQSSNTGQTGIFSDLGFLAPYNPPYVGDTTNVGTNVGATVGNLNAGIGTNIGSGNQNSNFPPLGSVFPSSSGFPVYESSSNTGSDDSDDPFPNYIPPPPSSNANNNQATQKHPVPNNTPQPSTRIRAPAPVIDYDYSGPASQIGERTVEPDADPFPNYVPPPSRKTDYPSSTQGRPFSNYFPPPSPITTTSVPALLVDFQFTAQTSSVTRTIDEVPLDVGGELEKLAVVQQRNAPNAWENRRN